MLIIIINLNHRYNQTESLAVVTYLLYKLTQRHKSDCAFTSFSLSTTTTELVTMQVLLLLGSVSSLLTLITGKCPPDKGTALPKLYSPHMNPNKFDNLRQHTHEYLQAST